MSTHEKAPAVGTQAGAITLARSIEDTTTFDGIRPAQWLSKAAERYARYGFEVGPLNGKIPIYGGGFHSFANDLDTVRNWWGRYPFANIGLRPPHGVVVVDIDVNSGGLETWAKLTAGHPVPDTLTIQTGSGGWHLWFMLPDADRELRAQLAHRNSGIDLKHGAKGYVVMPPSVHPGTGGVYLIHKWIVPVPLPDFLAPYAYKPQERYALPARLSNHYGGDGAGLVNFLAKQTQQGNRNMALNWAAYQAAQQGIDIRSELAEVAQSIGLEDREIQGTLKSAYGAALEVA